MKIKNMFSKLPDATQKEIVQVLLEQKNITIERIMTRGQTTNWSCQKRAEWVLLLKGEAKILFQKDNRLVELREGDILEIKPNQIHRVEWTDEGEDCVWLAIHYK
jgi:cupin 2 domain-containing protein